MRMFPSSPINQWTYRWSILYYNEVSLLSKKMEVTLHNYSWFLACTLINYIAAWICSGEWGKNKKNDHRRRFSWVERDLLIRNNGDQALLLCSSLLLGLKSAIWLGGSWDSISRVWYGPCRSFIPLLIESMNTSHPKGTVWIGFHFFWQRWWVLQYVLLQNAMSCHSIFWYGDLQTSQGSVQSKRDS